MCIRGIRKSEFYLHELIEKDNLAKNEKNKNKIIRKS